MQHDFWHERWAKNQIGFHLDNVNPHLRAYFATVMGSHNPPKRVLVPLCGKSLDIAWLLAQGVEVIGVELSAIAVNALFEHLQLSPSIDQAGTLQQYQTAGLTVFQGDFFALNVAQLGQIDAVYDRAALIALPAAMRLAYSQHLMTLTHPAPMLLVSIDYDQNIHAGPPFCVNAAEVRQLYGERYTIHALADEVIEGGLKGQYPAREQVWHLTPIGH